jgi:hypothetical protein
MTGPLERSPKKVGATGAVNLSKPLLPLGVDGPEDKSPRVCVIRVQGVEVDRWRQKTGGQEIQFRISNTLASCGVETGRRAPYKRRDGSYEWQLRWTPTWRGDKLVTWGTFTRLIGELEGPVSTNERVVIIRAYLQDGWKREGRPAQQE